MINFFRWLVGYVEFAFSKGFIEGFVNDCYHKNINIYDIVRDDNCLLGKCSATTYLRLHRIAHKNGGIVKVTRRHGIIFKLLKLKNRFGLFVGALCFVLIINIMGGYIWNIEIVGNDKISQQQMIDFLSENSMTLGTRWNSINKDVIENLIMASFDDCAWVHINQNGTTARIEINETVDKPTIVDDSNITNLKATKDGIIVKATVYDGWQVAKVGDSVVEGDLLISGIYESENEKKNFFAHAYGDFIAQVKEPFNLTISRQQSKKEYTETKVYKSINFFSLKIPLYVGSSKYINSDVEVSTSNVTLNKKVLPISFEKKTVKKYQIVSNALSDKKLTVLTQKEIDKALKNQFSDAEIISKKIEITLNTDDATAKGYVICLENIGKEVKISKKQ